MESASVRKSTEKCCNAAAMVQRCIYFANDWHKYVLPSQVTTCKEHKNVSSGKLIGLFSCKDNSQSTFITICKSRHTINILINIEADHWPQKEVLTKDEATYTVTSALPPSWSVAFAKHFHLWVSSSTKWVIPIPPVTLPEQCRTGKGQLSNSKA